MSFLDKNANIIEDIIRVSKDAGKSILDIYNSPNRDFELKKDSSPLTQADISSNTIILESLKRLTPKVPILSEEDSDIAFKERSNWKRYWLIDPLDGTKEFINRNGEFTVNIALISNNEPILGVIYIPVMDKIYWGAKNKGSYSINSDGKSTQINVSKDNGKVLRIVASRSHYNKNLDPILDSIGNYEIINVGSSLKFCSVASGEADLYIRLGPTCEWDTAAGEAILKFAGGIVVSTIGEPIFYNIKEDLINSNFIASSNIHLSEQILKRIKTLDIK